MASSENLRRSVQEGSSVSALIDDYRAQQEAWRAKAHDLARMREALRAAADREARAIVTAAQRDLDEVLRKANEALVALNAQVRALSEAADASLPAEQAGVRFGRRAGDLLQVAAIVHGAEQQLADVGHDMHARLDALADTAADTESPGPDAAPEPPRVAETTGPEQTPEARPSAASQAAMPVAEPRIEPPPSRPLERLEVEARPQLPAIDAIEGLEAFPTGGARGGEPAPDVQTPAMTPSSEPLGAVPEIAPRPGLPSSLRTFIAAFTVLGAVILAATGWWVWQSRVRYLAAADRVATSAAAPAGGESRPGTSSADVPASTPGTVSSGDTSAAGPATSEPAPATPPPAASGLSVQVEAVRAAWLRVTVDDRVIAAREFAPGETQVFSGVRDVQIRAGDAGAVRVAVGGAPAAPLGRDGQIITRRFAVDDPVPPAASTSPIPGTAPTSGGTNDPSPMSPRPKTDALSGSALVDADRAVVPAAAVIQPPAPASNTVAPAAPALRAAAPAVAGIAAAGPAGGTSSGESVTHNALETQFVRAVVRWFEAYQRQDRAGMAAFSSGPPSVSDERTESERAPRGAGGVRRTFEDVRLQLVTENAVFTTKMTERFDDPSTGRATQLDSFVSQLWTLRGGVWQLEDVRVVPTSKLLKQSLR